MPRVTQENLDIQLALIKQEQARLEVKVALQKHAAASAIQRAYWLAQEKSEALQVRERAHRERAAIIIQNALYWRPIERMEHQLQYEERIACTTLQKWVRSWLPRTRKLNEIARMNILAREKAQKALLCEQKQAQEKHMMGTCYVLCFCCCCCFFNPLYFAFCFVSTYYMPF